MKVTILWRNRGGEQGAKERGVEGGGRGEGGERGERRG